MAPSHAASARRWRGREALLRGLVVARLLSAAAGAIVTRVEVTIRANGAKWNDPMGKFTAKSWEEVRKSIEGSVFKGLGKEWWLADTQGRRVDTWAALVELPEEKRILSVVPEGRPFQWGTRPAGERFVVEMKDWKNVKLETVASLPNIFFIHNLFSEKEAAQLIELAQNRTGENALQKSGTGFKTQGARNVAATRTSSNAFDSESAAAKRIIDRCFEVLRIPAKKEQADGLQILKYAEGEAYISHTDWFHARAENAGHNFDSSTPEGSNRYATVFLYLWPPPSGGYTVFPKAVAEANLTDSDYVSTGRDTLKHQQAMAMAKKVYTDPNAWELKLMQECYTSPAVKPVRLGAALFYHQDPMTGKLLEEAEHGACPSLTGTKWGANLWIWNRDRHLSREPRSEPKAIKVTFENMESESVIVAYSMDTGDTWKDFTTVEPGQMTTANTYPSHSWRFTRLSGEEIRRFIVPDSTVEAYMRVTTRSAELKAETFEGQPSSADAHDAGTKSGNDEL